MKKNLYHIFIILPAILLLSGTGLKAQDNPPAPPGTVNPDTYRSDETLARQYFYANEYEKALPYFKKLARQFPERSYYVKQYVECLVLTGKSDDAIKFLKKKVKSRHNSPEYFVILGNLYEKQGDTKNQKRYFKKAMEAGIDNPVFLMTIANEFMRRNHTDKAVQLYEKAYKKTGDEYLLVRIGDIHKAYGNYTEMISYYLDFLDKAPDRSQTVKNKLQDALDKDKEGNIAAQLKKSLIRRVQEYPRKTWFSDLLLWFSLQKQDFETAFTQAKALDKRLKEKGKRMLELGKIAYENKDYTTAVKAADYILKKGKDSPYYFDALSLKVEAAYDKILNAPSPDPKDLVSLEQELVKIIADYGTNPNTLPVILRLSHLQTFYLNKSKEGINRLEKALINGSMSPKDKAYIKMELADEYLYTGDVWEATLLYSQIEKAMPHHPLAAKAKFKNAKLYFYIGEFDWAKTQLTVLKAATSKLIANDALYLSLLIKESEDEDTTHRALKYYAKASYLLFQNKPDQALKTLDSIFQLAIIHPLFDDALLKKAKIYLQMKKYDMAEKMLNKLIKDYPDAITTDDALWLSAQLYEDKIPDPEKAKQAYFRIIKEHPDSIYAEEARERYRKLRGDTTH